MEQIVKLCKRCNTKKLLDNFYKCEGMKDNHFNICKNCMKKFREINKEKIKNYDKLRYKTNKKIILNKQKIYIKNNIEKIKNYKQKYNIENKDKIKIYRNIHKDHYRNLHKAYCFNRYNKNINYKLSILLRNRLGKLLRKENKSESTLKLLDCSIEQLKEYLQRTALSNGYNTFNIENYDSTKYHIDHIIPCSKWNLKCSFHQKLCFNYINLQILKAEENLKKGDN